MSAVKDVYGNVTSGSLPLVSPMGIVLEGVIALSRIEKGDGLHAVMPIIGGKMGESCATLSPNG